MPNDNEGDYIYILCDVPEWWDSARCVIQGYFVNIVYYRNYFLRIINKNLASNDFSSSVISKETSNNVHTQCIFLQNIFMHI